MTAAAVATTEGEQAITRARAILAEDRSITMAEQQWIRDSMWRLSEAGDRITLGTLNAIVAEIDVRGLNRASAAAAALATAESGKRAQHKRERPQRWAALAPMERAGYLMVEFMRMNQLPLGEAFLRFATFANDPGTAERTPPETFEEDL